MRTLPRIPAVRRMRPTFLQMRHPLIVGSALVLLLAVIATAVRLAASR